MKRKDKIRFMNDAALAAALLAWHDAHARDLPWRGESDPYRIWISEIMLQQTRAETVRDYYAAFLRAFPDVYALAAADLQQVLKLWEGLGYYARARNLHAAAKQIAALPEGFPRTVEGLRALPGIGEYTAGAIASMAYGLREPAIDGNQIRVLARIYGIRQCAARGEGRRRIREAAYALLPAQRPGDFNQALMGLGALVCLPVSPRCEDCPAAAFCDARKRGDQADLPVLPAPPARKKERRAVLMALRGQTVLVRQRPESALLGGLWEFPNFENARTDAERRACLQELGVRAQDGVRAAEHRHVFTHLEWNMTGWFYRAAGADEPAEGRFVDADVLRALPFPTALAPFREAALEKLEQR